MLIEGYKRETQYRNVSPH